MERGRKTDVSIRLFYFLNHVDNVSAYCHCITSLIFEFHLAYFETGQVDYVVNQLE